MTQNDDTNQATPSIHAAPAAPPAPPVWATNQPPARRGPVRKVLRYIGVLIFLGSIVMNLYLLALVGAMTKAGMAEDVLRPGVEDQTVAVYTVGGVINGESTSAFWQFYRTVKDDANVKAVVVRVDSPGGGVSASDQIYQMVKDLRDKHDKKVVISMGGVAASGGYYISAPAQEIYAEPTTLTGSVGVIFAMPILKDFLDKHGVDVKVIRSRQAQRWKAAVNYFEQLDEGTYNSTQARMNHIHERFEQIVRLGRGAKLKTTPLEVLVKDFNGKEITVAQTAPLNGQVYNAQEALDIGLVDKIGYLMDATAAAAQLAGLDDYRVVEYSRRVSFMERMLGTSELRSPSPEAKLLERYLSDRPMLLWQGR